jgi:hypothetical protein
VINEDPTASNGTCPLDFKGCRSLRIKQSMNSIESSEMMEMQYGTLENVRYGMITHSLSVVKKFTFFQYAFVCF